MHSITYNVCHVKLNNTHTHTLAPESQTAYYYIYIKKIHLDINSDKKHCCIIHRHCKKTPPPSVCVKFYEIIAI